MLIDQRHIGLTLLWILHFRFFGYPILLNGVFIQSAEIKTYKRRTSVNLLVIHVDERYERLDLDYVCLRK